MIRNIRWILPKIQNNLQLPQVHAVKYYGKIFIQDAGFNVLFEIDISTKDLTVNANVPHTKHSVLRTFKMNGIHLN